MKLQQKKTPAKKPRHKMDNKDDITFDDIAIDLNDYGAAQASTMIDSLDTITLDSSVTTITLPSSAYAYNYGAPGSGGISTINNINGNSQWTTGTSGYTFSTAPSTVNITSTGIDMAAGTDITVDGKSLKEFMKKMEERLAILVPDPAKLEKFEALKKAYEHYKTIESLCFDEPIDEPEQ
jgi:hypothetical protein